MVYMTPAVDELWATARTSPQVDAAALADAVEAAASSGEPLDYRTRLLIRDSLSALNAHWGPARFEERLKRSPWRSKNKSACSMPLEGGPGDVGFPSLRSVVFNAIRRETVERFLRDLSRRITRPTRIVIG